MDYMSLFAKLERDLEQVQRAEDIEGTLSAILRRLIEEYRDELGLGAGRLYMRRGDLLRLRYEYPDRSDHVGMRIPISYKPVQELLANGFVYHRPADPGVDPVLEETLGVGLFAAITVGGTRRNVIAFSLDDDSHHDDIVATLNTIRHVVNLQLRKRHLETRMAQVRDIQMSLLPRATPEFEGYDIWGATRPAEEVGGDLYDFLPFSERSLGVAIADSAGHGLPAALQARDAIIGLRMGVEEELRITSTIAKLNRVVSHSALASRFITLFYCEIEPNGTLAYCNAGHNPPMLWHRGLVTTLNQGGMVLGPNPAAHYERGYVQMPLGSVLLLYTDGVTEAENDQGEMFGTERILEIFRSQPRASAEELGQRIFDEVRAFSETDPPVDDQTIVTVIRKPAH